MNLVVRMAIPIAVASCAIVIGLVSAMLGSSTPVAAQNEPATSAYITVEITAGDDTVSWSDPDECSSDYNIYKRSSRDSGGEIPRTHLGSATSGSTEATLAISDSSYSTIITLELYCGTYDSDSSDNELVASTEVRSGREGTYSSAPLTALTLSSGTLTPDFDRGFEWAGILTPDFDIEWGGYTAEVASDVEVITLDPTVLTGYQTDFIKDPGWGIVGICGGEHDDCIYGYGGGYILSDADPDTEGFQINLDRGENRLGIGVNTGSLKVNLGELYRLTVTVQNSPATGVPTISGTTQVWETLTADTSGIADVDGLNDVAFTYQWLADDTEIDGATSSTYTLQASDANNVIKVRVSFTDDAGYEESLTSEATGAVAANTLGTGAPTITGTVEVGGTLIAGTSGIEDEDGLDNATFTYQWIRSDLADDPTKWGSNLGDRTVDYDIDGATGATYAITTTDVGYAIKVRASYTDDAGNVESLTSSATVVVPIEVALTFSIEGTTVTCDRYNVYTYLVPRRECDDPTAIEQGASGEIEVEIEIARSVSNQLYKFYFQIYQMDASLNYTGMEANDLCLGPGLADSASMEVTPNDGTGPFTYTDEGTIFELCPAGTYRLEVPWYRYNYTDQEYEYAGTVRRVFFIIGSYEEDTSVERVTEITPLYPDPPVSHDDVQIEATKESEVLNRELATFSLFIGGLVPDSDLETTDYVVRLRVLGDYGPVAWCHVGDVGYSYLLKTVPEDGGWAMDAHVKGSCISNELAKIFSNELAVILSREWPPEKLRIELFNGSYEYIAGKSIVFRPQPNTSATGQLTISGTAQVGETLTADTAGIADADGLDDATFSYQWIANDGTSDADISGATGPTYALTSTEEDRAIKVKATFADDAGNEESLTSAATAAVAEANTAATGAPTISGTAQVGETLTVDTSGIADTDGLTNVTFSYQWLSSSGAEIDDATSSTYTLAAADEGRTIRVTVSFTDDAGNGETRTSTATSSVAARPNSPATGTPTISGTAQVGETLTADTSGIADDDGLTNVSYSYQWIRNDGTSDTDIEDATESSYTLKAADEGRTIKAQVTFTDDAGNGETRTSTATEAVSFAVQQQTANSPATGTPTISGTAQVGETLTADTAGIADADGLDDATFSYQWIANDGSTDTDIEDATESSYTLKDADEGKTIKVQVTFTDDAGNEESLTSAATAAVAEANTAATGAPTISGTAQVGETLTVDTSGIADTDGLTNATFSYQWLSSSGTEIDDATSSTYTLAAADEGRTIRVTVSFTDDAGNGETLTSGSTASVSAKVNQGSAPDTPDQPIGTAVFVGGVDLEWNDVLGADSYAVQLYRNGQWVDLPGDGVEIAFYGAGAIISELDPDSTLWFQVRAKNAHGSSEWSDYNSLGSTSQFRLGRRARPDNVPASGTPVITGTAQVGESLTADTTGIADGNGLDRVQFRFQWVSHDGSADTDIANATEPTYTLAASDAGKTIKVRVAFTDRGGYAESLTGEETATVAARPNSPATGAPAVTGIAQVGETLAADTSGIGDTDGLTRVSYSYQWVANDGNVDTDITDATDSTYALAAFDEGKTIKVKVSFTDDAGNEETLTSAATAAVDAAPNTPATGAPAISGTAQVGETLTADTSGIADADGLTKVSYSYQWVASDGTSDTDITGATDSTYTLAATDEGRTVQVKVSFTDDAGNEATLTSAATDEVTFAIQPQISNNPATGVPTISGTAQVGETLTADTSGIEDGLDNATFTYQWIRSDGTADLEDTGAPFHQTVPTDGTADLDIDGATTATYTVTVTDVDHAIKVRVSYTDDADNVESLTSSATVTVPIEVALTFSIEGTTVTCDSYNVHIVNLPIEECDDPTSTEQGASGAIEVELEIARSVSSQSYKFDFYIYTMEDSLGHYTTVGANDLCLGPGLAESALIEVTPDDGTGPFTYTDEGTIFELCPAGTYQLVVFWDRYNNTDQEYEYAGTFRRYFFITSDDEVDTSIERVKWIRALYPDPPVSHDAVQIEGTKESEVLNRELATYSLSIGGLVPDSDLATTDYVVRVRIIGDGGPGKTVPWCHVGNVGYSYLLKTVPEDGEWAMDAHVKGGCISHWWPDTLQFELFDGSYEFIAGKDISFNQLPNTSATGQPTITGTAQVSETLTADTSGIADADGLTNVAYSYQWLSSRDTVIEGATSSTYTLVNADEGKAIKVKVTFTDDAGNEETLTSAATDEVEAAPQPDSPATGEPTISGTAQVGETLMADTSGIADADGLTRVSYSYQWVANDGTDDTDITDATDSTYILVAAAEGQTIKVRVSFTDDVGNDESLTSAATVAVSFAVQQQVANTPATGAPVIAGTIQVGETVTADTSGIDDADGLENVTFTYRWLADDTAVQGATNATYTLVEADEGKTIKVGVTFTDDAGNEATLTSAATDAVAAPEPPDKPTGLSAAVSHDTVTLTWDNPQDDTITGYVILRRDREIHPVGTFVTLTGDTGSADTTYTDATVEPDKQYVYRIKASNEHGGVSERSDWVRANTPAVPVPDKPTGLSAAVSHDTLTLTWDDQQDDAITGYVILRRDREIHPVGTFVTLTGDTGSADTTYTDDTVEPDKQYVYRIKAINEHGGVSEKSDWVRANSPAAPQSNSPATGEPTITGTAQVGEELTVDTSGIADADGLNNAVFAYQWLSDDAEIGGATGSTYTLVADDEGRTIQVRATVTDDLGNETTLTSAATEAVEAAPSTDSPATGEPTITGTAQVGEELTVDTSGIADADGLDSAVFAYQWLSDDAEIGGATGSTYTLVADDEGRTIQVRVTFTDDAENETTLTSAATEAVAAAPPTDSPATGQPTITGTAQVGEELTVDTSGIADADGLNNAVFGYQWLSDDAEIGGATGSTYTLVDDDEGQTIKVRATVTDDLGNETTLTSAATEAVEAAPSTDSPATGEPTITGTAQVGEELTVDTSGIADADGLDSAVFAYQWLSDDAEIGGAAGSTYTLTEDDEGRTVKVRVTVTDDLGNETTLTSDATEAVDAKRNTAATGRPTISGTVRVGETLTADTTGIGDADALTNVSYSYQWVVTDGGAYFDISGETGATYTLVSADRGLYILVRVSFTDDAGKRETLTSAATEAVAAAP